MVGGVALLFVLGLPFFLFWVSTFSFAVAVSSFLVSNSPFSVLAFVILSKGSNSGAFAPPLVNNTNSGNLLGFVFFSRDYFGVVKPYERPSIEPSENWKNLDKDKSGRFRKMKNKF